jgi:hypothetical protein
VATPVYTHVEARTRAKDQWHDGHAGTWPLSQRSTQFNLDCYRSWLRS